MSQLVGKGYWHLVGRSQNADKHPPMDRPAPPTKYDPVPNVRCAGVENPVLEIRERQEKGFPWLFLLL